MNSAAESGIENQEHHRVGLAAQKAAGQRASRCTHLISIGIIILACVAIYWRVLFLGYTLLDVSTLNNQLPWGYSAGKSNYPYDRRDPTDMYVTREYFVVQAYRDGELPLWDPYTMAGIPMYADGVARIFSPFLLFYTVFDVPLGYSLARIAELLLAAVFMYLFLIGIGVSARGALFGSLVLELSSHAMMHVTGLGWFGGLLWLPLILLFADRAVHRNSYKDAIIAGLLFAAQFYCAFMPNQIYYLGAILLYYLFFGVIGYKRAAPEARKSVLLSRAAMASITVLTGFALSATQWMPVFELLKYSNRLIVGGELSYIYLPPWYAGTLIFPNLFGSTYDPRLVSLFAAVNVSHDHVMYIGIVGFLAIAFCFYCLFRRSGDSNPAESELKQGTPGPAPNADTLVVGSKAEKRNKRDEIVIPCEWDRLNYFLLLGAIGLFLMMAAPMYVPVTKYIPVLHSIRVVVRAGVLFIFSAAAVAAIGMELLLASRPGALEAFYRLAKKFLFLVIGLVAISIGIAYAVRSAGLQTMTPGRGKVAFLRHAAGLLSEQFTPPGIGILLPLVFLGAATCLLWCLSRLRLSRRTVYALLLALLFIDTAWNGIYFDRSYERSRVYPRTEITDFLKQSPPGRVLPEPSDLELNLTSEERGSTSKIISPPNTLLPYQISTITGKDQLFPKSYQQYARLVERQPNMSHVVFDSDHSPFFDLLNVRYIMTRESASPPPNSKLLKSAEGLSVYENESAMPRAFFAPRIVNASDEVAAFHLMKSPDFDPKKTVVIESGPSAAPVLAPEPSAGTGDIVESRRNTVIVSANSDSGGVLVLSDTFYPGWSAYLDDRKTEIYRADLTMRAVVVPAGRHTVRFVFAPRSLRVAEYLTGVGGVMVLVVLVAGGLTRRGRLADRSREDTQAFGPTGSD